MKIETALKWYNENILRVQMDTTASSEARAYISRLNETLTCLATYVSNFDNIQASNIELLKTVIEQQNQVIKALTNSRVGEGTYETEV